MFYFHEVIKGNKPVLRMANKKPEPIAPPVTPPKSRNQSTTSTGRNLSKMAKIELKILEIHGIDPETLSGKNYRSKWVVIPVELRVSGDFGLFMVSNSFCFIVRYKLISSIFCKT